MRSPVHNTEFEQHSVGCYPIKCRRDFLHADYYRLSSKNTAMNASAVMLSNAGDPNREFDLLCRCFSVGVIFADGECCNVRITRFFAFVAPGNVESDTVVV